MGRVHAWRKDVKVKLKPADTVQFHPTGWIGLVYHVRTCAKGREIVAYGLREDDRPDPDDPGFFEEGELVKVKKVSK